MSQKHASNLTRVIAIYRVKQANVDQFMGLLERHHPTLLRLGLATSEKPTIYRGLEQDGGPIVFEIFEWADAGAPEKAHHSPEVGEIWGAMGEICEDRDGRPKFMFPHVERIDS
ncbi:hypothetical protein [Engelhardtia mirabilis]|uniref:ABM domain-containing protein n=1 Tax=Engelhardtia mirabilis TaxID=2528011 RepID=A0A518BK90_9BACT|nr:hypothetical protein Pla133_24710 [Planctomycetes bacterium Pla133]QDV01715.1 hypothetical protein Pla86_24700 [Planctomycetes bacterium Pla86]